jgi:beta-glucosidase
MSHWIRQGACNRLGLLGLALLAAPRAGWSASDPDSDDFRAQATALVARMTLAEKAGLCSGRDFWTTKPVARLGIPSIFMTDGPAGLRKAAGADFANSQPATSFPSASALASSWDRALIARVGGAIAEEAQAADVAILLGPGVNMKRSPLGGRNFEYLSEDPFLAGAMAAAYIQGVQSRGVGATVKHFAANNQEFERMATSSDPDERTLHEIYLPAFEIAVREGRPWAVMCAYNRLNGVYCSENPLLLETILRQQWGFQGAVISDWGAVADRVAGLAAGLNLEMPASGGLNDGRLVAAVRDGRLPLARLDASVVELLTVILRAHAAHRPGQTSDPRAHDAVARDAAAGSIVLLKNTGLLPLDLARVGHLAVIGAFAKSPRFQGAGSSAVRPLRLANAFDALAALTGYPQRVSYAPGYSVAGEATPAELAEAASVARAADVAVVFAGLPSDYESEGRDRVSIDLPAGHRQLIERVAAVQPKTIVVLMNGSAVTMPWLGQVGAVVEGWLGGQAGGTALADILAGRINPSGKLAETFPVRLEDTPPYTDFPARNGSARYGEGVFIGYRWYDERKVAPLFPFGYGLSYTTFAYEGIELSAATAKDTDGVGVAVTVRNSGGRAGSEVVEVYVGPASDLRWRPVRELKGFAKVALAPGQRTTVHFHLGFRDFATYDIRMHDWVVPSGDYTVAVGGSSRDLPLQRSVHLTATRPTAPPLTRNSMLKEFAAQPAGAQVYAALKDRIVAIFGLEPKPDETPSARAAREQSTAATLMFMNETPVSRLVGFSRGSFTEAMLDDLLRETHP